MSDEERTVLVRTGIGKANNGRREEVRILDAGGAEIFAGMAGIAEGKDGTLRVAIIGRIRKAATVAVGPAAYAVIEDDAPRSAVKGMTVLAVTPAGQGS